MPSICFVSIRYISFHWECSRSLVNINRLWICLNTRGSHKQYSRWYFGAFNIFVIVFHSVFTSVHTVGLYTQGTHTPKHAADFEHLTQTRNRTSTAQNNYNHRNTIYSEKKTNNNNNIDSPTHITSRSAFFFRCSLSFLFIRSFIVPIAVRLL